jgi:hypothetical protein
MVPGRRYGLSCVGYRVLVVVVVGVEVWGVEVVSTVPYIAWPSNGACRATATTEPGAFLPCCGESGQVMLLHSQCTLVEALCLFL